MPVSALQQGYPVVHIYTFFFSYHPPSCSIPSNWTQFPVLHSRTPLPLRSKCKRLHLLTPSFHCFKNEDTWDPTRFVACPSTLLSFEQTVGYKKGLSSSRTGPYYLHFIYLFFLLMILFFPLELVYSVLSIFYSTARWPSCTYMYTFLFLILSCSILSD